MDHRGVKAGERLWERSFGWKRRWEVRQTLRRFSPELRRGARVLDVGSGRGYAAEVLEQEFGCEVVSCDVQVTSHEPDGFLVFDGLNLPFRNRSFDVVLLTFVLHHAQAPVKLLREATRVSRQAVLVVEDTPQRWLDRKWGRWHTRSFRMRAGLAWEGRVRAGQEWRELFDRAGLRVRRAESLRRWERLPPIARTAFVLERDD